MLVVLSGLPGSGKSAVAEDLGRALPAAVLSVDPVEAALWRAGVDRGQPTVPVCVIEVCCPDLELHRRRLEQRRRPIDGFYEPTWASVEARRPAFHGWEQERLMLDSTRSRADNLAAALAYLAR